MRHSRAGARVVCKQQCERLVADCTRQLGGVRQKYACTHCQLGTITHAPVSASHRAYRGMWFGTEICVKVLDLYAPLSPAGGSSSTFSAAPLLEGALSKALLHPNIVSGLAACCAQHHACARGCNPGMSRFQQSGSHRQRRIILQAPLFTTALLGCAGAHPRMGHQRGRDQCAGPAPQPSVDSAGGQRGQEEAQCMQRRGIRC